MRVGFGFDAHAFAEGRPLMLGGFEVPYGRGLAGHSDGDVLIHAVIDAMLGAAGLGDIGEMFPSTDGRWKDARGLDLLALAAKCVAEAGFGVGNVDATVVAEAPQLAPHIEAIKRAMGRALNLDITRINVKATTSDGMGFTGRGEGIAAFAVVLLE